MLLRGFLHSRHPIEGKGTLIRLVKDEPILRKLRVLCAFSEFQRLRGRRKGEIQEIDSAVGYVRNLKSLVGQKFLVGEKFPFPSLSAQDADALLPLRSGVPDARPPFDKIIVFNRLFHIDHFK